MSETRTIVIDAAIIEPKEGDKTFDIVFSSKGIEFTYNQRVDVRERQTIFWKQFRMIAKMAFSRHLNTESQFTFSN